MQEEDIVMTLKRHMTVKQENYYGKPWERQMLTNQLHILLEIYVYSNNKYRIIVESNLSDEYCNTNGFLQGCPMSPTLFRIHICRYSIGRKV
jgi:hypothetical protein